MNALNELEIVLSLKGEIPIYEQIEKQIKDKILIGQLQPGDSIPSMRTLAKLLRVSVITVQKAYENLKREGLIESAVGRGTVVSQVSQERKRKEKRKELEDHLKKAIEVSKVLQMDLEDLQEMVATLFTLNKEK